MKKLIFVISIIAIIIIMSILAFIFKNKKLSIANNNDNQILEDNSIKTENIENEKQNTLDNEITINENMANSNTNSLLEETKDINSKKTTTEKKIEVNTSNNKKSSSNIQNNSSTAQSNKNSEVKQDNNKLVDESKKEEKEDIKETVEEKIKYIRNDTMINNIKQIIESNTTEDMKNFGYTVVVDPTIKNITNQFTYTKDRVISSIRLKFGTIRIYAEDYYKNGQLIMTLCYII